MREGLIPTILGTGVTAAAAVMKMRNKQGRMMRSKNVIPVAQSALLGFGLAHIVLGTIDMVQHRK